MKEIQLLTKDFKAETVILANGEFPKSETALSILQNAQFLVCCDGATNQLLENNDRLPDAIVGDCDSVSEENKRRFADIIHHIPEQDTNDLTKAVNFCRTLNRTQITILGATGKREDHTLGNISLLANYLKFSDSNFEMITDYGIFNAISENTEFESFKGQQVSLFDVSRTPITTFNLKYPLQNQSLINLWEGTLNESLASAFQIMLNDRFVVFREF